MASTNKTTNYELSQFEGTDKPSWEADYNADMLAIDTNLKAVSDVANGASGDISTLDGRLTTAEGNITTNANDIDALEARADALEAGQTSDDSRLDALEAEQIVQNTAIESNTRLGYNLARPYDSASTYAVGAYVLFQDTLYKCTTAVTTGEAFDPSKWIAIKATDEIAAGGYTLPTASASTLGGVKVGDNLSIDSNGVLSGTVPTASASTLGGVKIGDNLSIDPVTGILSASSDVIITPLDTNNFPINVTYSGAGLGPISGTTTPSTTINNVRIALSSFGANFIANVGNLRILSLNYDIFFDAIQVATNYRLSFTFKFDNPTVLGTPSHKAVIYSRCDNANYEQYDTRLMLDSTGHTITALLKNPLSQSLSSQGFTADFILIYTV